MYRRHFWRAHHARDFTFAKCDCGAMMWKPHGGRKNGVEITDAEVSRWKPSHYTSHGHHS